MAVIRANVNAGFGLWASRHYMDGMSTVPRKAPAFVLVAVLVGGLSSSAYAQIRRDVWRPPSAVPSKCVAPQFDVLLLDISGSMTEAGHFRSALDKVGTYLSTEAPDCTLVIVASFGVTADVVGADFLTTADSRAQLANAARQLRATHRYTNLDEAAKLIELLGYQIQSAYGASPSDLRVRVYSDMISAASDGKSTFSLTEFLAARMADRRLRVSAETLAGEQRIRVQADPLPPAAPAQHPTQLPADTARSKRVMPLLALAVVGMLILITTALIRARARRSASPASALRLESLTVSEQVAANTNSPTDAPIERRLRTETGVPVIFSTDPLRATYIARHVAGTVDGELFRIDSARDGSITVRSPYATLEVNGVALGPALHRATDLSTAARIQLGPRLFIVNGGFTRLTASRVCGDVFEAGPLHQ
jgi:hypothetical protein